MSSLKPKRKRSAKINGDDFYTIPTPTILLTLLIFVVTVSIILIIQLWRVQSPTILEETTITRPT